MSNNKKDLSPAKYTIEEVNVGDLTIDREIQRYVMSTKKVEAIVHDFSEEALGIITVSRRDRVTMVILDGWHRTQAVKELTDNQGTILCKVYEGLTKAQEAMLFLKLNAGNQPNLLEKFKAKLVAGDPVAMEVIKLVHAYGWTVTPQTGNGNIQCVGALERIYSRSVEIEAEPNLLHLALLVITKAWGIERTAGQAAILEGIAVLFKEFGDAVEVDRVVNKLNVWPGGPSGLHSDASKMASLRRGRVSIALAELIAEEYNKGKQSKRLGPVRTRRL